MEDSVTLINNLIQDIDSKPHCIDLKHFRCILLDISSQISAGLDRSTGKELENRLEKSEQLNLSLGKIFNKVKEELISIAKLVYPVTEFNSIKNNIDTSNTESFLVLEAFIKQAYREKFFNKGDVIKLDSIPCQKIDVSSVKIGG